MREFPQIPPQQIQRYRMRGPSSDAPVEASSSVDELSEEDPLPELVPEEPAPLEEPLSELLELLELLVEPEPLELLELDEGFLGEIELGFLAEPEDVLAGCSVTSSSATPTCSLLAWFSAR